MESEREVSSRSAVEFMDRSITSRWDKQKPKVHSYIYQGFIHSEERIPWDFTLTGQVSPTALRSLYILCHIFWSRVVLVSLACDSLNCDSV